MIVDLVLLVACLVVIGLVAWRADKRVEAAIREMRGQTEAREAALNKQAKVFVRKLEQSRRAAMRTVDESRASLEEARTLNANTQGFFKDHRVQRFLNRGEE